MSRKWKCQLCGVMDDIYNQRFCKEESGENEGLGQKDGESEKDWESEKDAEKEKNGPKTVNLVEQLEDNAVRHLEQDFQFAFNYVIERAE